MPIIDALLNGVTLGGVYALIALGLSLQYGVARIMNLSYGQFLIAAAFGSYALFSVWAISPILGLVLIAVISFFVNGVLYRVMLVPLVRRSKNKEALEVSSILATFGLLFVIEGILLVLVGGNYFSYSYIDKVYVVLGTPLAANRLLALGFAIVLGGLLYGLLFHTRQGQALRAVASSPQAAQLVAINIQMACTLAFSIGGALVAASGVLVSLFITFNASMGVVFTMKALIVVIMGGVGHLGGCLLAGFVLGMTESFVSTFVAPGLTLASTYALFLLVLALRPNGLFGRAAT